ncbi:type II toxin-antitoxin system VapC family toxin [Bdellovibrionota bacterium FG-1]
MSSSLVLDSSVWIEILNKGPLAKDCLRALKGAHAIYVPTLVLFEVYKKLASSRSEDQALSAVAMMSQYKVTDMTREIALAAADISLQRDLAMADSVVLAHAQQTGATLVTLDNDFAGISGVEVFRKE